MKNILINVSREKRTVSLTKRILGNDGENLQSNLVFSFIDEFVDGQARIEYVIDNEKRYQFLTKENESYIIPIKNVLTKEGKIDMQLVITEGTSQEEIPIFKSNVFYLICNRSINAEIEQPDEYLQWIEIANTKLNEIDEAVNEVNNLDIDAVKVDNVSTITITKKDGSTESVRILDGKQGEKGEPGPQGEPGADGSIVFEDLTPEQKEELRGPQGIQGIPGEKGEDGLTTAIRVNDQTYNQENGIVTLPDYPSPGVTEGRVQEMINASIGNALGGSY